MMKITGLSHLFKWENLHNWWLTKYFFAPLYIQYEGEGFAVRTPIEKREAREEGMALRLKSPPQFICSKNL